MDFSRGQIYVYLMAQCKQLRGSALKKRLLSLEIGFMRYYFINGRFFITHKVERLALLKFGFHLIDINWG